MLYLLSPAKTLDYDTPTRPEVLARATKPQFVARSAALIDVLKTKTPAEVASLMSLSDALAQLNVARYAAWRKTFTPKNSKPAVLAFAGDVYDGLDAKTLTLADLEWAQDHLVILSGLYGALRPLDLMQPYRLEMGTRLHTDAAEDLYGFWGDTLAEHLNRRLKDDPPPVVVNLASQEYAKAALRPALKARVVDCVFEDWKGGQYKVISFFAKRARGAMARYAITHRIDTPAALAGFDGDGYAFDAAASTPERLVFRRRVAD
ncbi:peroxide stress protein YaaA [Azohydromonas sediminis]|uniref:peroxide stress protein YaaA n=1 Tax=Azohydromonas sediminis TaxID=2259674 RepID=UPI000E653E84|nr:peroxide stress protein YaaA [Azohydromonas sediminis]